MLVKSIGLVEHLVDLCETLTILRKYKMRFNHTKCTFGMDSVKFLGFIDLEMGIEANPKTINIIIGMKPPRNITEVQRLTGCVAAVNRYISRVMDKCLPLFKILQKAHK